MVEARNDWLGGEGDQVPGEGAGVGGRWVLGAERSPGRVRGSLHCHIFRA
jgi:hypothetical protein